MVLGCFMGYMFWNLTTGFMADETSIDVSLTEARELEFPAITVCNANPIKKSALEAAAGDNKQLQQLLDLDAPGGKKKKRKKRAGVYNYVICCSKLGIVLATTGDLQLWCVVGRSDGLLVNAISKHLSEVFST